jgi:hypothetical protein
VIKVATIVYEMLPPFHSSMHRWGLVVASEQKINRPPPWSRWLTTLGGSQNVNHEDKKL